MSSVLINEIPIFFQSNLALKIGVNEAIFVERLRYLLNPKFNKNIREGKNWVYNTYAQWLEIFPFWSRNTLVRTIQSVEKKELVTSFNMCRDKSNRTKWYTLNYEKLDSLEIGTSTQNGQMDVLKMGKRSTQNGQMQHLPKMGKSLYQDNTQENLSKNNNKKGNTKYLEGIPSTGVNFCIPSNYSCFDALPEIANVETEVSECPQKQKNKTQKTNFEIEKDFKKFWEEYPNKVEKAYALDCFKKALLKTSIEKILTALREQKNEVAERERLGLWIRPWKNPSTWLNKGCWEDISKTMEQLKKEQQEQANRFGKKNVDEEDEDMKKLNKILEGCL
jgi:hypothetical protein